jgi:hypothetical protein
LFKSEATRPREQTDFLKVAFLDFAMNHWGRGIVDHKLAKQLGALIPKRYLTQTEFAAQIGVVPSTGGTKAAFWDHPGPERKNPRILRSNDPLLRSKVCAQYILRLNPFIALKRCYIALKRFARNIKGTSMAKNRTRDRIGEEDIAAIIAAVVACQQLEYDEVPFGSC